MPTWLLVAIGVVVFLGVCAAMESRLGIDLAGATGTLLAGAFVGAILLAAIYGVVVLIVGHDPLGLGFDQASPPDECQQVPPTTAGC